jgi:peptidoglycan/LPS O-acetylase OafA/YrhL
MNAQKQHYYPWFDWLRGILAITVMLTHEGLIGWERSGNFAVQVFFALSGWLIGSILIKLKPEQLTKFYFNRAIRIWVPYYLALILLVCASLLRDPITGKWLEFVFYKLSFVYNIFGNSQLADYVQAMPLQGTGNHFWSVNAEEQFYLLAPLILVFVRHPFARSTLLWLVIAAVAYFTNIYASIVFGVLAAVAVSQYGSFHEKSISKLIFSIILIASIIGFYQHFNYDKIVPFAAISIILLLSHKGEQNKIGAVFGGMSYQLYLNHWIGLFVAHALLKPYGLRDSVYSYMISILLNIAIAIGLYWFIDKRLQEIRGELFTKKRGLITTTIAYSMVIIGCLVGFTLLNA